MTLAIISASLRFLLTAIITYKLIWWGHMLNKVERIGLGVIGGSSFMTIPIIVDIHKEGTPFDTWASILFTLGVAIYLLGRLSRHVRHQRANDAMAAQYEARMAARGQR